eukprot:4272567-Amphidinium_carterae.1
MGSMVSRNAHGSVSTTSSKEASRGWPGKSSSGVAATARAILVLLHLYDIQLHRVTSLGDNGHLTSLL